MAAAASANAMAAAAEAEGCGLAAPPCEPPELSGLPGAPRFLLAGLLLGQAQRSAAPVGAGAAGSALSAVAEEAEAAGSGTGGGAEVSVALYVAFSEAPRTAFARVSAARCLARHSGEQGLGLLRSSAGAEAPGFSGLSTCVRASTA